MSTPTTEPTQQTSPYDTPPADRKKDLAAIIALLFIGHGVRLVQTANSLTAAATAQLHDTAQVIVALILATDFSSTADVGTTLATCKSLIEDSYQQIAAESATSLADLPAIEAQFVVSTINKVADSTLMRTPTLTVNEPHLDSAPLSAWWEAQREDTISKVIHTVRAGVAAAATAEEIADSLTAPGGPLQNAVRNAETLTHTAVQRVAMDARNATLLANTNVVEGIQIVATLDSRTCAQCLAYDGSTYDRSGKPLGKTSLPFNGGPAFHFNCRCGTVPLLVGQPAPRSPTAEEWLDSQTPEEQDDLLGPGRANLYRKGSLTLRDLVSGNGSQLSLADLRKKYN
jgi:hypothetical protein